RYRKEATGSLNDEQLRDLSEQLASLRALEEKKQQVLFSIEEQGKLTDDLRAAIESARTQVAVDDLYRPYRPKRKTRAGIAKAKGLEPLAEYILAQTATEPLLKEAAKYVTTAAEADKTGSGPDELAVRTPEEALQGAQDIIAEQISDNAEYRTWIREETWKLGTIQTAEKQAAGRTTAAAAGKTGGAGTAGAAAGKSGGARLVSAVAEHGGAAAAERTGKETADASARKTGAVPTAENKKLESRRTVYEMYFDFEEALNKIPGHRILAINRGENEKFLTVKINAPEEQILQYLETRLLLHPERPNPYTTPVLREAVRDSYERLIAPSIERELRTGLTESAEDGAIVVFRKNLEQLLMQPPIAGQVVLGWDPAFRTGCKISVVDPTGRVLDTTVVYPTAPQFRVDETKRTIKQLIKKDHVTLISLGNGTASRESEQIIAELIREYAAENPKEKPVQYIIVNEAGASVYSASRLATEEFPNFDVGQRSATSMARRLQDPLAELVKIDPKAVGVGQYQHDMNQKKLDEALGGVVEDCVNRVGVDLNTASFSLLSYISGISAALAKNIVAYREANGRFQSRRELLKVPKLGPKAFEQCAGFLRIQGGKEPLDATAVHPENYDAVKELLHSLGLADDPASFRMAGLLVKDKKRTAERIGIGEVTLRDILTELEKPARDPREDMPKPILKSDVLSIGDLAPGMKLKGTVRNIVDFGAFVDIGVHQDGLVHISRMADHRIKSPMEVVKVGDIVDVTVVSVDRQRGRIALSMNGKM
ncbi:MAG: Tex family protein, partial [Lachnospiraceae bacterium]|nr:Tex family protein [Lachnospiraceae bacterium]